MESAGLADEHYWFRSVVGGESFGFFPPGPNAEWQLSPGESAEDVFSLYRDEIQRANAVIASTPLDMPPRQPDERWQEWGSTFQISGTSCCTSSRKRPAMPGTSTQPGNLSTAAQWIVL